MTSEAGQGGERTAEAVIRRIAEVANAVGWQGGVGASETAGLIVSVLANRPELIERFMREGHELFIDGLMMPERGCLSWHSMNGALVTPELMRAHLTVADIKRRNGIKLVPPSEKTEP